MIAPAICRSFLFVSCCRKLLALERRMKLKQIASLSSTGVLMHRGRPSEVGQVSWHDVWNWVADLESTWHCYVTIQQWRVRKEGFYGKWDIRIVAKWLGVGGAVVREEAVNGVFPGNAHKTLAGTQLGMVLELDRKLEELAREKQEGAEAQGRFAF
jgi:hypothetical protein